MNTKGAYKKKEANLKNVRHRHALLQELLLAPEKTPQEVRDSLGNQRTFSALHFKPKNIHPISLNTAKALAAQLFPESEFGKNSGFLYFDSLRLELLKKLENQRNKSNAHATSPRLKKDIVNGLRLASVERESLIRSRAYADLFYSIKKIVDSKEGGDVLRVRLDAVLNNSAALYGSLLSPSDKNRKSVELVKN